MKESSQNIPGDNCGVDCKRRRWFGVKGSQSCRSAETVVRGHPFVMMEHYKMESAVEYEVELE